MNIFGFVLSYLHDEYVKERIGGFDPQRRDEQKKECMDKVLRKCPWYLRRSLRKDIEDSEWFYETMGKFDYLTQYPPGQEESFDDVRQRMRKFFEDVVQ